MMRRFAAFLTMILIMFASSAFADDASMKAALAKFSEGEGYAAVEAGIEALGTTGDPTAATVLNALEAGLLVKRRSDGAIFIMNKSGTTLKDAATGADAGAADPAAFEKIKIKNSIRKKITAALSGMTLLSPDRQTRLKAAATIFASADTSQLAALESAIAAEQDSVVKAAMEQARASVQLTASKDAEVVKQAIATIAARGDQIALKVLNNATGKLQGEAATKLEASIAGINNKLALWNVGQNVWYGISLGSVLLLAAIGLAITFGVMGVINMAHGEMVMLGAYTTFVVQQFLTANISGLVEYGLAFAIPLAFLVSGATGLVIERTIIRQLYGRPLETLLATWGVSLILQQSIRSIFGATNREVSNPSWMSDGFAFGHMTITYNRFWILIFALVVFFSLLVILKRTSFGLQMRAVTQNRRMASSMGIATPWVDALTFALGSGIAGIAGVALSQIDNVSPDLGQSYIIDSFMVVVFGGVGNLWGTLVGALSLGIANKFLEPYAGAVLAKILVLVLIILFIQKRPRGLFALKGRAVEA